MAKAAALSEIYFAPVFHNGPVGGDHVGAVTISVVKDFPQVFSRIGRAFFYAESAWLRPFYF